MNWQKYGKVFMDLKVTKLLTIVLTPANRNIQYMNASIYLFIFANLVLSLFIIKLFTLILPGFEMIDEDYMYLCH